jgi:TetR/AcrR family transcriptional regulator of autoinduction and epiphytic fitness
MKRTRKLNEEKHQAILDAAINEFYEKGFEGSSMDAIAREANVSKATVYKHFSSKEELFFALAGILLERFEESFKYEYNQNKRIEEQLKEIAYKELNFLNDDESIKLIQIMTVVMIQKSEIGLKLLESAKDECMEMSVIWFEKAKADGKLNFESSLFVSKQFIGMIKSFAFYPQMYGAPKLTKDEEEKLVKSAIDMIIKLYAI